MFKARDALLLFAIEIGRERNARLLTRFDEDIEQFIIGAVGFFHRQGAALAVIFFVALAFKIFGFFKIRQHAFIRPTRIAQLVPMVIVRRIAANINHRIDGRRPAPTAPTRPIHLPPFEARFGFGFKGIILVIALWHDLRIASRHMDEQVFIFLTRL